MEQNEQRCSKCGEVYIKFAFYDKDICPRCSIKEGKSTPDDSDFIEEDDGEDR